MTLSIRHLLLSFGLVFLLFGFSEAKDITLAWDRNPEAEVVGYKVYYKAESSAAPLDGWGAYEGDSPITVGNLTTAKLSGLMDSQTYYFAVSAVNAAGVESPLSEIVASAAVPVLTSPARGAITTQRPVTLRWDYVPFTAGMSYTVRIGTDPSLPVTGTQAASIPSNSNNSNAAFAGLFGLGLLGGGLAARRSRFLALALWVAACFSLAACGGGGGGTDGTSSGVSLIFPDGDSTGTTTNPVTTNPVTTNPVTTNPVTTNPVTTNPVTTNPVTTTPSPSATTLVLNDLTTPFATVTELLPGTTYYWQVYAVDPQGYRYESLVHSFTTAAQ